ncbi:BZ3500_MvSof-1268-A1-R1_Chr7-3g09639 [Microbotryum saponariae]|uniref:BZ3500_MvSof-1268-A1-R1_Chr7-3g09639 protein n=1 Tax=Microbotryum saponariae TaxID=289078 RepID=A0A2X0NBH8_9BASI|nr:BZ3501_MvSof-1269-A2-R1_Chr7-2g09362 [Microbotryum saponariae]SDA02327.1 BZ3500_MvSof-1268-A1-R1_Chr7-3g09639 [Microbotryum saponariae]
MSGSAPLLPSPPSTSTRTLSAGWHLASGAISGAVSVLALQPLDLIKTRVQQEAQQRGVTAGNPSSIAGSNPKHSGIGLRSAGTTATSTASTSTLRSSVTTIPKSSSASAVKGKSIPNVALIPYRAKIWTTARMVVAQEGIILSKRDAQISGLLNRVIFSCSNVPGVSLYFLTLSRLRNLIGSFPMFRPKHLAASPPGSKIKLTTAGDLLVGSTARTGVGFILMPATLLKTLSESSIIAQPNQPRPSSLQILSKLYRTGGLASLWRGAVPTALRDAPGAGLFIVFYERGRRLLGVRAEGAAGGGVAGASASLLSTLLTTPFDLLKTRRQLSPEVYTTLWGSAKKVWQLHGLKGFWQGGALRVVRKAGSAGIGWAVYEGVVGFGEKRRMEGIKFASG